VSPREIILPSLQRARKLKTSALRSFLVPSAGRQTSIFALLDGRCGAAFVCNIVHIHLRVRAWDGELQRIRKAAVWCTLHMQLAGFDLAAPAKEEV
jgi:hypothetical protein